MADIPTYKIAEVLGVQTTDDGKHMLVGFKTVSGDEIALALDAGSVWDTLNDFIEATALEPFKKGTQQSESVSFSADWFEIGKIIDSGDLALTFLRGKAHVTFRLPTGMAEKLGETLATALGKQFSPPAAPQTKN